MCWCLQKLNREAGESPAQTRCCNKQYVLVKKPLFY